MKYSQKVTLIKKLDHALVTEVLTHERSNDWGKSIEVVPCNTLLHFWDYGDSQGHHFSSGASPFSKSPLDSCAPELKLCPIALWAPGHHRSLSVKTETDTRMSLRTSLHWMCKKFCKGGWPHRSPSKSILYKALHICQAFLVGKDQQRNHMRQRTKKEKSLYLRTCTLCPYEARVKSNLNRHTAKAHSAKEIESKSSKACPECGKLFPSQKKLTRQKKNHLTQSGANGKTKHCNWVCNIYENRKGFNHTRISMCLVLKIMQRLP